MAEVKQVKVRGGKYECDTTDLGAFTYDVFEFVPGMRLEVLVPKKEILAISLSKFKRH